MLMVKNLYLSTINTRHAPPPPPLLRTCHRVVLLTYDKAQSSVSHTRHHGRVTELALRRRHPRSPSLRLCRSPVFAISLGNPCALQIVRSWPGMAVGRWRPPRYRDAEDAGAPWAWPSPLCSLGQTAVGQSPEPGRLSLLRWLLRPKTVVGRWFPLGRPVSQKEKWVSVFLLFFRKKNDLEKMLCTHFGSKNCETNFVVILMSRSMA
jgi:hypothetical protein